MLVKFLVISIFIITLVFLILMIAITSNVKNDKIQQESEIEILKYQQLNRDIEFIKYVFKDTFNKINKLTNFKIDSIEHMVGLDRIIIRSKIRYDKDKYFLDDIINRINDNFNTISLEENYLFYDNETGLWFPIYYVEYGEISDSNSISTEIKCIVRDRRYYKETEL